ncbi:carboxylesterase/lipase family protein [soil metagenome]
MSAAVAAFASPALIGTSHAAIPKPVIVQTRNGALRGARCNGIASFKGVPYAADTSGANRFLAPQPVPPWTGERDATSYGPLCPQAKPKLGSEDMFDWYDQPEPLGEACCVLNVFTPGLDSQARRPVMFYIHGGGFVNGGGGGDALDGTNLANFGDVVVVTINHRLNVFGYSDLSRAGPRFADSANAGHLDIVAALAWVRDSIASFGGDPGNVTVFGQSAGGAKVTILLAMPEAQGLFHRAINMSGVHALDTDEPSAMAPYVDALVAELGLVSNDIAALQAVPYDKLLAARSRALTRSRLDGARPVIDGRHIVTRPMSEAGLAMHAKVPLMLGSTKTEASLFFQDDMRNFKLTDNQMRERMRTLFKIDDTRVDAIVAAYRRANDKLTPSETFIAAVSDVQYRLPLTRLAELKSAAARQAPVYMYSFNWEIPAMGGVLGAPHAVDIPFAFGTVDEAGPMVGKGPAPMETSLNMMSAFVSFARTGNPNNARMPTWGPYDATSRTTMLINEVCATASDYRGVELAAVAGLAVDPFDRAAYRYKE